MISDMINGSASTYTIVYTDSVFGTVCGGAEIDFVLCERELCRHLFDSLTSECSATTNIEISVSAINALGEGPSSPSIFQGLLQIRSYNDQVLCVSQYFIIRRNKRFCGDRF